MKIQFSDITLLYETGEVLPHAYVTVDGPVITYLSDQPDTSHADRVIDGHDRILMPAFYNAHTHAAMTLFRGYGEDMPLDRWLYDKIFPAEDLLYGDAVKSASNAAIAEMLRCGVVSFSDMYFFCNETANCVLDTGIKANISRAISCFDPDMTAERDYRFTEAKALHRDFHNAGDGRIKIDMAIHAEYTMTPNACVWVAQYAEDNNLILQLHLSETEKEQAECIERHGKTPARFFADLGVFRAKTDAAHCCYLTDEDIDILHEYGVTAIHNPVSNCKLGSGIMPLSRLHEAGIGIALGTDGAASNNSLDVMREMNMAALLQKVRDRSCDTMHATDFLYMATRAGALAQGREDCGTIRLGARADLVMLDASDISFMPLYDVPSAVVYAASSRNVAMTMADGKILYENGTYYTLDIEKVRAELQAVTDHYFEPRA